MYLTNELYVCVDPVVDSESYKAKAQETKDKKEDDVCSDCTENRTGIPYRNLHCRHGIFDKTQNKDNFYP